MLRPQVSITLQTRSVLRSGATDGPGPAGPAARVEGFRETARFAAPRARRNGSVLWADFDRERTGATGVQGNDG